MNDFIRRQARLQAAEEVSAIEAGIKARRALVVVPVLVRELSDAVAGMGSRAVQVTDAFQDFDVACMWADA